MAIDPVTRGFQYELDRIAWDIANSDWCIWSTGGPQCIYCRMLGWLQKASPAEGFPMYHGVIITHAKDCLYRECLAYTESLK